MSETQILGLNQTRDERVEELKFEPIKGYPMLHWRGKRPFTSTRYYPAQIKERHGEPINGWMNKIYWGDNLQVMSHLLREYRKTVDLVYIDPPFDSKADYKKLVKLAGETINGSHSAFEEKQYTDIWLHDEYLQFIYERLILTRELLAKDATIYVHIDASRGHQLRCLMDEIFGSEYFRNEVIWFYENKLGTGGQALDSRHDSLLVYTKSKEWTFNPILVPVKEAKMQPVTQKIEGKRVWLRDVQGSRLYQESRLERPLGDVWQIPIINPVASERLGYPTQKPEQLLRQVIEISSNPNDLVFDCFMGSGTTQAVAMRLGRRFIGADINLGAIQTTTKRLLNVANQLNNPLQQKVIGEIEDEQLTSFYTGFEVYNVNHYDVFRNPLEAKDLLLEALEVNKLPQGQLFDGEKDGRMVKIMPVNRIATRADLNELITGFDIKSFEKRQAESPTKPVERVMLVCMGHEPDLAAQLKREMHPYLLVVEVVDILRDKKDLSFKRDSEAKITLESGRLTIARFYPMNLLQKLSLETEKVDDWRELVESVMIDWNYAGGALEPKTVDIPEKNKLVRGVYNVPDDAGTIRVKITDVLSESLEVTVEYD